MAASSVSMVMLTPPVLVRRVPTGLVAAVAGLAISAGLLAAGSVDRRVERLVPEPPISAAVVFAQTSPRNRAIDLIGAHAHRPDGIPDEVLDVEIVSTLAVKDIVLRSHNGSEQWDTAIGGAAHLGVRANGAWIERSQTGTLGVARRLELIASGGSYGCGRSVTVTFVDGTTVTDMIPMTWTASTYPAEDVGCDGNHRGDYRPAKP